MNKKIEELYDQILSGDGWDSSTLDKLILEAQQDGEEVAERNTRNRINSHIILCEIYIKSGINIETNTAIINTLKSLIL